jgi:hypothetical protein
MPGLTYGEKVNAEMLTYHHNEYFSLAELPFITNGAGDGSQATIINCSSLSASQGRSKSIRIQAIDSGNQAFVLNLWFGSTIPEIEQAILTGAPAQILDFGYGADMTFPIGTEYFAIDYNAALTGASLAPETFMMSITIV